MTTTLKFSAADQDAKLQELRSIAPEGEFDFSLDTEVITDKDLRKAVPCRKCRRVCVVTTFATREKTECSACRGHGKKQHRDTVVQKQAVTASAATIASLENLVDGLINPAFKTAPHCPFDPEHTMELKSITHSPTYGPRQFRGWVGNVPKYDQETGESVIYQCRECLTTVSMSTMHPLPLRAMNEARRLNPRPAAQPSVLTELLGVSG